MVLIMSRKKVFLLLISLVFMISLFANFVSAQEEEGALAGAFDVIRRVFGFIPEMVTLEKLADGDLTAVFWAKFLVWVLLFSIVFFGTTAVPGLREKKNIAVVIAIVISIISVVMIPTAIIFNIFQTYGLIAGVLLWFIPLGAALYINHKIQNRWLKVLFLFGAIIILVSINRALASLSGAEGLFDWFVLLLVIVILMFIWNLVAAIGGNTGGVGGGLGNAGRGFWDWATKPGKREPKPSGREPVTTGPVSPAEEKAMSKAAKSARKVAFKEEKYFMRVFEFVKRLVAAIKSKNTAELRKICNEIKKFESREQMWASVRKIKGRLEELLKTPLKGDIKNRIMNCYEQIRVFEAKILTETTKIYKTVTKETKSGNFSDATWVALIKSAEQLEKDLQAETTLLESLKDALNAVEDGLKQEVKAEEKASKAKKSARKKEIKKNIKEIKKEEELLSDEENIVKELTKLENSLVDYGKKKTTKKEFKKMMLKQISWMREEVQYLYRLFKHEVIIENLERDANAQLQKELKLSAEARGRNKFVREMILKEQNLLHAFNKVLSDFTRFINNLPNEGIVTKEEIKTTKDYIYYIIRITRILIDVNKKQVVGFQKTVVV